MNRFIAPYYFLLLFTVFENINAQLSETAIPYSITSKLSPIKTFVQMPSFDQEMLLNEDQTNSADGSKKFRFAKMFSVSLQPYNSGTWVTTDQGRVWRLGIKSEGAYSLYLIFNEYHLCNEVRLFVYNEDFSDFKGALTSLNNNPANILSVAPLPGEALIIELDVPEGINDFGRLELNKIGHDYHNVFGKQNLKSAYLGPSQNCMVDINCPEGNEWQNEKRAVCRMIVNAEFCTGTLINNAGSQVLPYILTARHCVETAAIAASAIFFFNYERPFCGSASETVSKTLSGASLIASGDTLLDFSLLKLNKFPPVMYRPYFAGWDINPFSPNGGVCIHHPNGDVKKISVEKHRLVTGNYRKLEPKYDPNSHWLIQHWETGSTQAGSSGAPIFNSAHRLFGTLTGGQADCLDPTNDYFSKLSRGWADYPDPVNQLETWLDPNYTAVTFLDGIDPYGFTDANCDTISNLSKKDTLEINQSNLSWGVISGHNSAGYTQFAEKFYAYDSLHLPGIFLNVAKAYNSSIFSTITVKVWNGVGIPTSEKYSKEVYIKDLQKNRNNFIDFDSLLIMYGPFFIGYKLTYKNPADTFAVYHGVSRGSGGLSSMYIYDGIWHNIKEITIPAIHTSLGISFPGCIGLNLTVKVPEVVKQSLRIFPNPCTDYAIVEFPYALESLKIVCVDMMGKKINLSYAPEEKGIRLNLTGLHSGVYAIILKTRKKQWSGRFMIVEDN